MNPIIPRLARRMAARSNPNSGPSKCLFCQQASASTTTTTTTTTSFAQSRPQWQRQPSETWRASTSVTGNLVGGPKRYFSGAQPRQQQQQQQTQPGGAGGKGSGAAVHGMARVEEVYRRRNRSTAYYTISIILGTVALSYGSVPMYKMICQTTGWGGQPVRAHGGASPSSSSPDDLASRLEPVTDARRIRVTFSSSVSDVLPWKFTPQQREVRVLPGETALAFYTATNTSDKDIVGVATYSVTPAQTAPYFSKIQCFCFEEQRLAAGETVDMPVFFYLDPDLLKDLNMRNVHTVTLNYTFFKARYDDKGNFQGAPGF